VPGLLFMLLGPLQFSSTIRARHLRWHRWSGRVFVVCGVVIGISALVMSLGMPAIGGFNQAAATTLFASFFLFALCKAFWYIRRREIPLHREWMIRAFSVGFAVATIRPIIGMFFATSRFSALAPHEFFGIAFWIGFVLHLIAAEAWIHATLPQQQTVGESNGGSGVAPSRFGQRLLFRKFRKLFQNCRTKVIVCDDPELFRGARGSSRETVCWIMVCVPSSASSCLARFLRLSGQKRVPRPPARMTG